MIKEGKMTRVSSSFEVLSNALMGAEWVSQEKGEKEGADTEVPEGTVAINSSSLMNRCDGWILWRKMSS